MRRATSALLIFFLLVTGGNAQALSWAYPFVTWDGKMYEVMEDQTLEASEVGAVIGEVEMQADDMTGDYYGDASNVYEKGTKYYEILGTPKEVAIAVQVGNNWVQAVFVGDQPISLKDIFTSPWLFVCTGLLIGGFVYFIIRGVRQGGH
ncbi:hypothetical protein ACFO0S_14595 [Chryseomicrobium palamuruense]|uniref:Uncharacterized protein n=1 Tax=Chryseomicrobium palamuruense TaxID=682973 RepID=A0ABV8UY65_9BACL